MRTLVLKTTLLKYGPPSVFIHQLSMLIITLARLLTLGCISKRCNNMLDLMQVDFKMLTYFNYTSFTLLYLNAPSCLDKTGAYFTTSNVSITLSLTTVKDLRPYYSTWAIVTLLYRLNCRKCLTKHFSKTFKRLSFCLGKSLILARIHKNLSISQCFVKAIAHKAH